MAQSFMSFPMVVWEVQNIYSLKKQTSPAFNFLGVNWKLHFHYYCSIRGEFVKIVLRRIAPLSTIPCFFCAKTSIVVANAPCFETNTSIDTSSSNEWCVWNEEKQNISSYIGGSALMFLCCIQPESRWREILHENADKGMKIPESNADVDSLRNDFGNLFDEHVGADVIFKCRGEKIYAHRAVLSSRSQVLAAMLQNNTRELFHITDTEPFIFTLFLRYLYTGYLPRVTLNAAAKLYFVADRYGIDILKKNCVIFMMGGDASEGISESSSEKTSRLTISRRLRNIKQVLCIDNWKYLNEVQLKMSLDAFHTLFKDIYNELGTEQEVDRAFVNRGLQKKKIKLIKIEYDEE